MQRLSAVILLSLHLSLVEAQDSLQIKRNEITWRLNNAFSGNWSYQVIDSSSVLGWDTIFQFPSNLLRIRIFENKSPQHKPVTTYFFNFSDIAEVFKTIFASNSRKGLDDSLNAEYVIPEMNSDGEFLALTFGMNEENYDALEDKFTSELKLERPEIKLTEIKEEEENHVPPPPPPKKIKRMKQ